MSLKQGVRLLCKVYIWWNSASILDIWGKIIGATYMRVQHICEDIWYRTRKPSVSPKHQLIYETAKYIRQSETNNRIPDSLSEKENFVNEINTSEKFLHNTFHDGLV